MTSIKIGILTMRPESYSVKRLVEAAEQRGHQAKTIGSSSSTVHVEVVVERSETRPTGALRAPSRDSA